MTTIVLPPVFDVSAAVELTAPLLAATGAVTIEADAVERIGIAGLQLLLCARMTADVARQSIAIERPSEALLDAARLAGADVLLLSTPAR